MAQRGGSYSSPRYAAGRAQRLQPQSPEARIPPPPMLPQVLTDFVNDLPPPNFWPSALLSFFVIDPLISLIQVVIDIVVSPRTHRFVLRVGVLSGILWTALGLAIAAYVGFYRAWVPDIGISNEVWLQYGHDRPPFADIDLRSIQAQRSVFAEDQRYDVSLEIIVPLSAANIDLGNFMVSLELISPTNNTLIRASRPTIIVHESAPVRAMNNLAFQLTRNAPSILLPTMSPPVQLITIPLLQRAILQPPLTARPFARVEGEGVVRAHVSVGRHDSNKYWMYGGGHGVGGVMKESGGILKAAAGAEGFRSRGELQTHSVNLRFDAHLTGLRYFMYHHPLASFLLFTSMFLFLELISALTLWAIAALYTSSLTQTSLAVEDNYRGGGLQESSSETDTTALGRRPLRRSANDEDDEDDADSATVTGPESEGEDNAQSQSLASLQARDAQEEYEARRVEMLRDEQEGRRMTAVDAPSRTGGLEELDLLAQGRRVLGRLDEETEEETDVAPSEGGSIGWEDVGEDTEREEEEGEGDEAYDENDGLRRRRGDAGDRESIAQGSSTSRAPSTVRSFGALSSFGGTRASVPPSTAPSTVLSRSQTEATPEVKQEEETLEPEAGPND